MFVLHDFVFFQNQLLTIHSQGFWHFTSHRKHVNHDSTNRFSVGYSYFHEVQNSRSRGHENTLPFPPHLNLMCRHQSEGKSHDKKQPQAARVLSVTTCGLFFLLWIRVSSQRRYIPEINLVFSLF